MASPLESGKPKAIAIFDSLILALCNYAGHTLKLCDSVWFGLVFRFRFTLSCSGVLLMPIKT